MKSCDNCIHQDICSIYQNILKSYIALGEDTSQCNHEAIANDCEHYLKNET